MIQGFIDIARRHHEKPGLRRFTYALTVPPKNSQIAPIAKSKISVFVAPGLQNSLGSIYSGA
ncbi:hypothetical protein WAI453_013591 [Rhynchosporium graminicola]